MMATVLTAAAGRAATVSLRRSRNAIQPLGAAYANSCAPLLAQSADGVLSGCDCRSYHVHTSGGGRRGHGELRLAGKNNLAGMGLLRGAHRQQTRHLALTKRKRRLQTLMKNPDKRPAPNWSPDPDLDAQLMDEDSLFPPPTKDSVRKRGLPLLVRAAHHAKEGRTLCYDLYFDRPTSSSSGGESEEEGKEEVDAGKGARRKVRHTYADVLERSTTIHHFLLKKIREAERVRKEEEKVEIEAKKRAEYEARRLNADLEYEAEDEEHYEEDERLSSPPRIAFLCHPGSDYIAVQWASWSVGAVAVPLCPLHRSPELRYVLDDAAPLVIVDGTALQQTGGGSDDDDGSSAALREAVDDAGLTDRLVDLRDILGDNAWGEEELVRKMEGRNAVHQLGRRRVKSLDDPAMILYTSGTTGPPKGVVSTHRNLYHQVTDLVTAWEWTADDAILHLLPLHHVHGIVNKLCCAAWAGASVEFVRFHPRRTWERLAEPYDVDGAETRPEQFKRPLTLFMAVPTVYAKMLEAVPTLPTETILDAQKNSFDEGGRVRLTVSGSAALPVSVFRRWKELTGQTILERYGMTEFGMSLSNPLEPVEGRRPGYVGLPLPSADVKIVDEDTGEDIPDASEEDVIPTGGGGEGAAVDDGEDHSLLLDRSGELLVRGPHVFDRYWNKPEATAAAFTGDGYFRTGDVAEYDPLRQSYRILGRASADIIKCAGHKLSSLQIERVLLEHPRVAEAVVMGVPDEAYGERVGLLCRMKAEPGGGEANDDAGGEVVAPLTLKELKGWCAERMAPYKVPTRLRVVEDVPKNAMGKVSKKQLLHLFEDGE